MNKFTPPPKGPKVPTRRRYEWWRVRNGFPSHPKWRVVSHLTGLPIGNVIAIVTCLQEEANGAHRRGCVEDFNPFECAVTLGYEHTDVQAVYDALKSTQIGWIDQDFIVSWYENNPDQDDPTALERKQRQRARQRAERQEQAVTSRVTERDNVTRDVPKGHGRHAVTNRDTQVTRDVTQEQIRDTNSLPESVSLADPPLPPVDIVDKSDNFPSPANSNESKLNGTGRADELATALPAGALARRFEQRLQPKPNPDDPNDGLSDEAAWAGMGIEPLLPCPLGQVTRLLDRPGILGDAPRKPLATWPELLPPGWDGWKQ